MAATDYGADYASAMKGERACGIWGLEYIMSGHELDPNGLSTRTDASPVGRLFRKTWSYALRPVVYADGTRCLRGMAKQIEFLPLPYRSRSVKQREWDERAQHAPWYALFSSMIQKDS